MGPGDNMAATFTDPMNSLPNIPCLETNRSNWTVFLLHFQEAMEAYGKWEHFNGTSTYPVPTDANAPTTDEKKAIANETR